MNRSKLGFLLLTCPLLACADDIPATPDTESSSSGDTTGVGPTTVTVTVTDTTTDATTIGLDSTGSSSSGEPGTSSSGEPGTSSSGEPGTSSSGDGSSSSSSSGGPACGDDNQDGTEECDGTDLAGYNCVTLGPDFTGGTLACAPDCTFDTSACFVCGNDMIDGPEVCDGADLGGNDCASMGFVDGTLTCAADCTFDTSACTTCGNDVIDAGEACDGGDLGGQGCADVGGGFTGGLLGCDVACGYDTTGCTNFPYPLAGEVIVTEIMQNPFVLIDDDGEWFEVHNPTLGTSFQLETCSFEGAADMGFTIDVDMVIGPGEYRIFATDSLLDQGFVPDYQWLFTDYNLTNGSDLVRIVCSGVVVDEVAWDDGATFPDPNGQSMNLDPGSYDAVGNDDGANWCAATTPFPTGDFGTPGADNEVCGAGPIDYPIGFCRLQFPDVIIEDQGTDVDVFGRLYIAGLTDLSGVNDLAPQVSGSVGYGPDGTDPAVDLTWTWVPGTPNAGYGPASPGYEANNDEYQAVLSVPGPGTYDYAFRFSGDGGTTFTYCDGQPAGSSDGYQPANAGQMTSNAVALPTLYFSEYVEGSSFNKAVEIYNPGVGAADIDACELRFYFNGAVMATTNIGLAGSIAADDVLVVCDDEISNPGVCDVLDTNIAWFNGDDAIELACSGTTLDVIGQIGLDPGTEWAVAGVGTQNETIRRSCAVTMGDANGADAFDPSLEWASFPQDTFDDLGQYVCP
jgi:hypothetical protein